MFGYRCAAPRISGTDFGNRCAAIVSAEPDRDGCSAVDFREQRCCLAKMSSVQKSQNCISAVRSIISYILKVLLLDCAFIRILGGEE
jgi:hypothetical protein